MTQREERISEVMNLIGYGLAKFDIDFVREFSMPSKSAFARFIVEIGLANTVRSVLNRMDSFDPYFDNGRRGWFQRNQREHIKLFIDSLFGNENAHDFANIVKLYIKFINTDALITTDNVSPITQSRFKQLQETGKEAEFYFLNNFKMIETFADGNIQDARLWGDGYDFQIQCGNTFMLAEVKGLKEKRGGVRMTNNEYQKAQEYRSDYYLIVVSNLLNTPKMSYIQDPTSRIIFQPRYTRTETITYYSDNLVW